jgi:hypothetical protein
LWQALVDVLWPKGGWTRAATYVKHRLNRLPDSPHRIARGIMAGVFTVFTPFYGLHFFMAAGFALLLRGNVVAALLGTGRWVASSSMPARIFGTTSCRSSRTRRRTGPT